MVVGIGWKAISHQHKPNRDNQPTWSKRISWKIHAKLYPLSKYIYSLEWYSYKIHNPFGWSCDCRTSSANRRCNTREITWDNDKSADPAGWRKLKANSRPNTSMFRRGLNHDQPLLVCTCLSDNIVAMAACTSSCSPNLSIVVSARSFPPHSRWPPNTRTSVSPGPRLVAVMEW